MVEAGGWFLNGDGTEATVDSPENLEALQYLQTNLAAGSFAYPSASTRAGAVRPSAPARPR